MMKKNRCVQPSCGISLGWMRLVLLRQPVVCSSSLAKTRDQPTKISLKPLPLRRPIKISQPPRFKTTKGRLTSQEEIKNKFVEHYQMVFQIQSLTDGWREATQKIMELIPCRVSKEQHRACALNLSLDELAETLLEMADDKALGLDGFPYDFYKATWEFARLHLLQVYREALANDSLGVEMNRDLLLNLFQRQATQNLSPIVDPLPCSLCLIRLWPRHWLYASSISFRKSSTQSRLALSINDSF